MEIWQAGNSDRNIVLLTMRSTLHIPLQFAVLVGIGTSVVYYLLETSRPRVRAVKMSDDFRYFTPRPGQPSCPQLGVVEILGDLYFGAVSHIEESITRISGPIRASDSCCYAHTRSRIAISAGSVRWRALSVPIATAGVKSISFTSRSP